MKIIQFLYAFVFTTIFFSATAHYQFDFTFNESQTKSIVQTAQNQNPNNISLTQP